MPRHPRPHDFEWNHRSAAARHARALLERVTPAMLRQHLAERLASIPNGQFTTYGALARDLGSRHAAVWVAQTVRDNTWEPALPRQRVLTAVEATRSADREVKWTGQGPLASLVAEQERLSKERRDVAVAKPCTPLPEVVLALDVSYGSRSDRGVAACVAWQVREQRPVWSATATVENVLPYMPTLLAWRELPPLWSVAEQAIAAGFGEVPALVDGAGSMHPLRLGVATHLGLVTGLRTLGVAKSILCGRIDEQRTVADRHPAIVLDGETVAAAVTSRPGGPALLVSGGHGVSVEQAAIWVAELGDGGRLVPPIREADRLSRAVARCT